MKISIITVSYNSEKFIKDAIESVINQTYKNIEYIIIDGKSNDNTLNIIKYYSKANKCIKYISEKDKGIYNAMNKGLKLASGDIISILNSDDIFYDKFVLEDVIKIFNEERKISILYGNAVYVKRNNVNKEIRYWNPGKYNFEKLSKGWQPCHLAFFAKRQIYEKYGVFNENYKIAADYDLIIRFMINTRDTFFFNRIIGKMRAGGLSNSNFLNIFKANIECYKSLRDNKIKVDPLFVLKKPLSKIKQKVFVKREII